MANVPPQVGTVWRANFFRMDMPAGKPQSGTAWSPPLVGDFHALDKFGELAFGDETGKLPPPPAVARPLQPAPAGAPLQKAQMVAPPPALKTPAPPSK